MQLRLLNRDLLIHLVKRDFSLQYKRSVLGILWSLLLPIFQLLILIVIFQKIIPLNIDAYPAFLFTALLPWSWFASTLGAAGNIFVNNKDLVLRPNFDPTILVMVNTLTSLVTFLVAIPILLVLLINYQYYPTFNFLYIILLIIIQGLFITGLCFVIAIVNVLYADIQYIVNVLLMLLFYVSPIFYGANSIGEKYMSLYLLNPFAALIHNYRLVIFYGKAPDWVSVIFAFTISIIILIFGRYLYRKYMDDVLDLV